MRVCIRCGYVATGAQRHCARCVAPLDAAERIDDLVTGGEADTSALPLVVDDGSADEDDQFDPYGWSRHAPGRPRQRRPARRARMTSAALTTVALLLGVLTVWVAVGHHGPRPAAGSRLSGSQTGAGRPGHRPAATAPAHSPGPSAPQSAGSPSAVPSSTAPAPAPAPSATPGASQPPGGSMPVAMAPAVRGDPAAAQIQVLVASYFTAINDHDFQAYRHLLLGPLRHQLSAAQFTQAYGSTTDSDVTLVRVSVNGPDAAATVTFTSQPSPGSGGDAAACTSWRVTLYLQHRGGRFLVSAPPPGYHPAQHACGTAG
jgi:hypothetical protein